MVLKSAAISLDCWSKTLYIVFTSQIFKIKSTREHFHFLFLIPTIQHSCTKSFISLNSSAHLRVAYKLKHCWSLARYNSHPSRPRESSRDTLDTLFAQHQNKIIRTSAETQFRQGDLNGKQLGIYGHSLLPEQSSSS